MRHGVRRAVLARRTAVGVLLAVALLALLGSGAFASSAHGGPVTAVSAKNGHQYPDNPVLHAGDTVVLTATGFASQAQVTVGLVGVRLLGDVQADGAGASEYTFTVPAAPGSGAHALIFSGAGRSQGTRRARGNVEVTVPLTEQWPFRTPGGHGVKGEHGEHDHGHGTAGGGVSHTGFDALVLLAAGALAVVAGIGFAVSGGRRRRGRPRASSGAS